MLQLLQRLLLILLVATSTPSWARGPESGGGGTTVKINSQFVLLDFLNLPNYERIHQSVLKEQNDFILKTSSPDPDQVQIQAVALFRKWSVEVGYLAISADAPLLISGQTQIQLTDQVPNYSGFFFPVFLNSKMKTYPTAFYVSKTNTIKVSKLIWPQMDEVNQLALLVHENLRHLQLNLHHDFDDEFLQKATLMVLLCKPSPEAIFLISTHISPQLKSNAMARLEKNLNRCLPSNLGNLK
jgi:hypothetical protein